MSADVIVGLVLVAGGVCGLVLLKLQGHRGNDLHARVARDNVVPQGVQHSEPNDHVQREQAERSADEPTDDESERRGIHGRSVHRAPVTMPPGIPSITERLDRWTELS